MYVLVYLFVIAGLIELSDGRITLGDGFTSIQCVQIKDYGDNHALIEQRVTESNQLTTSNYCQQFYIKSLEPLIQKDYMKVFVCYLNFAH